MQAQRLTKRKNEMKNELTQRIEQMRLEAEQQGTPLILALTKARTESLDFILVQQAEIARLTREVETWYSDAVDFATERDAALAEIAALRRAGQQALDALDNGLPEARDKAATALRQAMTQAV